MKRIIVLLLLLVSAITAVQAFQIQQYGYRFDGFFIEIYSLDNLPTIYTDKTDGYIDIKVYSLDQEDLTGALTIGDVRISGDPLYAIRQTVKENQRLTLPVDSMKGLRLLVVTSESKTAKVMTSYRTVGAQLLKHEKGAMLRLWTREDSIFIKDFSLYRLRDGSLIGKAEDGLFVFDSLPESGEAVLVQSPYGSLLWKPGEYDYYLPSRYVSMTFTDRPAYKAGETVNFRSFIREITPEGYKIPKLGPVEVEITDPLNRSVYKENLTPDELGSIDSSFKTYSEITRGSYRIIVRWEGNEDYYYFQIADYKKPTFFTTAEATAKVFKKGEAVSIDVKSQYYFGDPVSLGKVDYTIYKGGQYIDNGTARLDGVGETVIGYNGPLDPGYYYAVVTVSDDTGMQSRTTVDFKIVQGTFGFVTEYTLNNKQLMAKIETRLNDDTPVSKTIEVKAWYEQSVTLIDQGKAVEKKVKINVVRREITTGSDGKAEFTVDLAEVPDDNLVYVELSGAPSGEAEVTDRYSIYVGSYYDYYGSLTLDRITPAAPGSKASLSFFSSSELDLWIIADFSGTFSQFPYHALAGKNAVEVEIPEGYAYESFVLYLVSYKNYQMNYSWMIEVDSPLKDYSVKLITEERYAPGENVNLKVEVTDPDGKPASVGLTVAVVSQAMLSLFEGDQDYWKGSLMNPFYRGFGSITLVDLYYSPYPTIARLGDLLESQPPAAESKMLANEAYGMGDRGGSGEGLTSDVKARKLFSDSALWSVGTFTDEAGRAELAFVVPEDLDTWTVRALASDMGGGFSYARSSFETWKPMTVSSFLPEFLIAGDKVQLVFSVKNNTDSQMPVLSGFYVDGKVIEEKGSTVPAFQSSTFRYEVNVPDLEASQKDEKLTVKFVVEGSRGSDGVEYEIPVKPRFTYVRFGELDFLNGERTLEFSANSVGWITVASTIDPILLEAIRYLVDYPYGCVEQTMSRFLPAVAASKLLESADEAFADRVKVVTDQSLERLYGYQHYDGGWGWWRDDQTDAFMTAYVMYGFYLAMENGYEINNDVIRMGYSAMKDLHSSSPDPFLQYVIALFSRKLRDPISAIVDYKSDVPSMILSSLTAKVFNLNERAKSLFDEAMSYVDLESDKPIKGSSFNYFFDETVTLSFLLKAAVNLQISPDAIGAISRKLLTMGDGSYWYRTASTALAVASLASFSSSLSSDAEITVTANGSPIEAGSNGTSLTFAIVPGVMTIKTTGLVAVSINGESAIPAEEVKPSESGIGLERILRRKLSVPMDNTYVLTTPQLDSPYVVASLKLLSPDEVEGLEIDVARQLEGMELAVVDGELMLGSYHLGLKIYEGEIMGSTPEGFVLKTVESDYYLSGVEIYLMTLKPQSPVKAGETVISEVRVNIPENAPYIVVEDMLPSTGIAIEENPEGDMLGFSKFYYFDYWWGYTFREDRFDRVAFFFRYGGEFVTRTTWRVLTTGEFLMPAVQAWAMYDGQYSANTSSILLKVE